jgi:superkiller protein 3
MYFKNQSSMQRLFSFSITAALLIVSFFITAQDLPPNEDLSLGASVFVFRSNKTSQKKFVSSANRTRRTKNQRVVAAKKIRKQYENLASVTTRRKRVKTITPQTEVATTIKTKSPKEASQDFTGFGLYFYQQNELDKSIDAYREAIDLDEKNIDAKLGLSDALAMKAGSLLDSDKTIEARGLFDEAIQLNDKNSVAYSGLGEIYDASDENGKAILNYEKALALDSGLTELYAPLGVLYYQKDDITRADNYLSKALTTDSSDAMTQYLLGMIRYKQNRYEDARVALEQATKLDTTMAEAHLTLGETLDKLDRDAEALAAFNEAKRLKPNYVDAWFNLGVAYYEQGKYEEAIAAYKETVRLKNDLGEAHANLADSYRQLKRYGEANGSYSIAANFIKDDAELYSNWGFCLGMVNKWDNAITSLNKALALSADHIDYTNLGWAYYNAAQVDLRSNRKPESQAKLLQAKTALSKAVGMNQNFAPANLNLGITLNDLGEYQAAVDALKRANDSRKNWIFAINELGIAYRKLNDFDNAIKQFEKAVGINDKYAIGFFNLGEAQLRRGNVKEAKKAHEKLKKLDKNMANSLEIMILRADKNVKIN